MRTLDVAALIVPFGLVLARVGAFIASCPLFVSETVPASVRTALGLMLAGALTVALPRSALPPSLALAVMGEVALGILFGLCVRVVGLSIHFAGELIDVGVGFSFARQVNPMNNEEAGPLTRLSQLVAALTFVMADGQHTVVRQLAHSLVLVPPGSAAFDANWSTLLSTRFADLLAVGVRLAMPIVLTLMGVQLALALMARLSPSLNIWGVGFLATSGMGLVALWLYTPAWLETMGLMWRMQSTWSWGGA